MLHAVHEPLEHAVQFGSMEVQATQEPLTISKPVAQAVQALWLHCAQFGKTEEQA